MIASVKHNNTFVTKVSNITNLFKWNNALDEGFPDLPTDSIIVPETLVKRYIAEGDKSYLHHATISRSYGKVWCSYTIHDEDEDAAGMFTNISVSTDDGFTWEDLGAICPSMSTMAPYSNNTSTQWSYPSTFIKIPSGFYLLINTVSGITNISNYETLGTLVRKINSDNSFGDLQWVNNGIEGNRIQPTPISGFPYYDFASEDLIEEVTTYISQPGFRPKILFGWNEIWSAQENYYLDSNNKLREPTEIKPYNYTETLKVWKSNTFDFNVIQNGEDNNTQIQGDIPNNSNSTARRFENWTPEIIITVGHTNNSTRTELMLAIGRKNNNSGQYEFADGDVYSVSSNPKITNVTTGHNKSGGEQLAYICRNGKNKLNIAYSYSKEEIYFKAIDISKLI